MAQDPLSSLLSQPEDRHPLRSYSLPSLSFGSGILPTLDNLPPWFLKMRLWASRPLQTVALAAPSGPTSGLGEPPGIWNAKPALVGGSLGIYNKQHSEKSIQAGREIWEPTGAGWRWAWLILCAHLLSLGIAWVANVCTVSQPPVGTGLLSPALAPLCNPHLPSDQGCHRRLSTPLGKPHCLPQSRLSPSPAVHLVTVLSSAVLDGSWF